MIDCSRPSLPNDGALQCLSHAPASFAAHGGKFGLCPSIDADESACGLATAERRRPDLASMQILKNLIQNLCGPRSGEIFSKPQWVPACWLCITPIPMVPQPHFPSLRRSANAARLALRQMPTKSPQSRPTAHATADAHVRCLPSPQTHSLGKILKTGSGRQEKSGKNLSLSLRNKTKIKINGLSLKNLLQAQ